MYGFQIRNSSDQEIILGNEQSYLLYNRLTVSRTLPLAPNSYNEDLFVDNWLHGALYQWMRPIMFVSCPNWRDHVRHCYLTPAFDSNGNVIDDRMRVKIAGTSYAGGNQTMNFYLYIFVPAQFIKKPAYGLELYNEKGVLAFHNGALPLRIEGIHRASATIGNVLGNPFPVIMKVNYPKDDNYFAYFSASNNVQGYDPDVGGYVHSNPYENRPIPYISRAYYS